MNSAFPRISHPVSCDSLRNRINGVFPTYPSIPEYLAVMRSGSLRREMYDSPPELSSPRKFFLLESAVRPVQLGEPRCVRGQRSIYIWENPKYSIKPRSFQNRADGFLHTTQEKLPAILFNLSHG